LNDSNKEMLGGLTRRALHHSGITVVMVSQEEEEEEEEYLVLGV